MTGVVPFLQDLRNAGATYSLVGSDGSDVELATKPSAIDTEVNFNGLIKPGVTYTVTFTANASVSGIAENPPGPFMGQASFFVTIGSPLPEPADDAPTCIWNSYLRRILAWRCCFAQRYSLNGSHSQSGRSSV